MIRRTIAVAAALSEIVQICAVLNGRSDGRRKRRSLTYRFRRVGPGTVYRTIEAAWRGGRKAAQKVREKALAVTSALPRRRDGRPTVATVNRKLLIFMGKYGGRCRDHTYGFQTFLVLSLCL